MLKWKAVLCLLMGITLIGCGESSDGIITAPSAPVVTQPVAPSAPPVVPPVVPPVAPVTPPTTPGECSSVSPGGDGRVVVFTNNSSSICDAVTARWDMPFPAGHPEWLSAQKFLDAQEVHLAPGESKTLTFEKPTSKNYVCPHPIQEDVYYGILLKDIGPEGGNIHPSGGRYLARNWWFDNVGYACPPTNACAIGSSTLNVTSTTTATTVEVDIIATVTGQDNSGVLTYDGAVLPFTNGIAIHKSIPRPEPGQQTKNITVRLVRSAGGQECDAKAETIVVPPKETLPTVAWVNVEVACIAGPTLNSRITVTTSNVATVIGGPDSRSFKSEVPQNVSWTPGVHSLTATAQPGAKFDNGNTTKVISVTIVDCRIQAPQVAWITADVVCLAGTEFNSRVTVTTSGVATVTGQPGNIDFRSEVPKNVNWAPGGHTLTGVAADGRKFDNGSTTKVISVTIVDCRTPPPLAPWCFAEPVSIDAGGTIRFRIDPVHRGDGTYVWDFPGGNPRTGTGPTPSSRFDKRGTYQVSVTSAGFTDFCPVYIGKKCQKEHEHACPGPDKCRTSQCAKDHCHDD